MYISVPELIVFFILFLIFYFGMFSYANDKGREWSEKYFELDERYRSLYEEYKILCDEKLSEKIKNSKIDNSYKPEEENQPLCQICKSSENVEHYITDGYKETSEGKYYFSGGFDMCKKCLNACEICECGKLKIPFFLEKYFGDFMKHPNFCNCHETPEQKKARNFREYEKYEQNCYDAIKSKKISNNKHEET